jgi:uncharacterized protein (TIGR02246 family)
MSLEQDRKAIRDVVILWAKATAEGDLATVMDLMTDDVVFLTPGNLPMMREAFRAGFENMIRNVTVKAKPDVQGLDITADGDVAMSWGRLEVETEPKSGGPAKMAQGHT